jgi:hypothetical protein
VKRFAAMRYPSPGSERSRATTGLAVDGAGLPNEWRRFRILGDSEKSHDRRSGQSPANSRPAYPSAQQLAVLRTFRLGLLRVSPVPQ